MVRSAIAIVLVLAGCGDDGAPERATDTEADGTTGGATSTSSTSPDPSTSTSTGESSGGSSESDAGSGTTAAACIPGEEGCTCLGDFSCGDGLLCELNTCIACEAGTFACPCLPGDDEEDPGVCGAGLSCVAGLCATAPPCPWRNNGQCDEPRGTGACYEGTDPEDCDGATGTDTDTDSGTGTDSGSDSGSATDTDTDTDATTGAEDG